ncbi:MAG: OmpA family protein [Anaerohalosphaeraceae bacterium]|nr:OmpA family protein [Anaerohalosphaeraceae bacterium]
MSTFTKKILALSFVFVAATFLTGCTSYKKKYTALNVEHQNLKGLYENCQSTLEGSSSEKEEIAQRLAEGEQTIDELRQQIEERNQTPGQATGFGENYQVDVDSTAGTITVTLPNTILFDSGKAILKQSVKTDLNYIVSVINEKYSGRLIDVVGHTDSDPIKKSKWKDNWQLSSERALAVLRQLNANGVLDDSIRAIGCGQGRPVGPNKTSSGKARNRRVEIVVHMR